MQKEHIHRGVSEKVEHDCRDFGKEGKLLFGAIQSIEGFYELQTHILILRGSKKFRISEKMKECPQYGQGKYKSEDWWKAFGQLLIKENFLDINKVGSFSSTVSLSSKGRKWCENATLNPSCTPLHLQMSQELKTLEEPKVWISMEKNNPSSAAPAVKKIICLSYDKPTVDMDTREEELKGELFCELFSLRNKMADSKGIAPYMVFSNLNLLEIAFHRPCYLKSLKKIESITDAQITKFGKEVVEVIKSFCKAKNMEEEVFAVEKSSQKIILKLDPRISSLKASAQLTYKMWSIEDKEVSQIATERHLATSTILDHLCEAAEAGLYVNLTRVGVTRRIFHAVINVINSPPVNFDLTKLWPIKQRCPNYVEFSHIKFVCCWLKNNHGLNEVPAGKEEKSTATTVSPSKEDKDSSTSHGHSSRELFKRKLDCTSNESKYRKDNY